MKKRIFGIFTFIVLMLSCVSFSACSNKYKKMEFEIMYAFSADATEWHNVENGLILNYDSDDDILDETKTNVEIFFKVDILNVKSKHIDDIIVSRDGGNISYVKQHEVFKVVIPVERMSLLKFYETNSGKETKFEVGAFPILEGIFIKENALTPAVFKGGRLNLVSLLNIDYYPGTTNQTGVEYKASYDLVNYDTELEDGILEVPSDFTGDQISILAISKHNPDISTVFNVSVLETSTIGVKFNGGDFVNNNAVLYPGSENYSTIEFDVSKPMDYDNLNFKDKYVLRVYVDGSSTYYGEDPVNDLQGVNGLMISVNDNIVTVTGMNVDRLFNNLKFVWEMDGYLIPENSYLNKEIKIYKRNLPTTVLVNRNKVEGIGLTNIYDTNNSDYLGLKINLSAAPLDLETINSKTTKIIIENTTGLKLKNQYGEEFTKSGSSYIIDHDTDVYFSFDDEVQRADVEFKVRNTPEIFKGVDVGADYSVVNYRFVRKVTADSMTALNANKEDLERDEDLNSNILYLKKASTNYFVLKVDHSKGTLASDTITIKSENANVLFANGQQEIKLNHSSIDSEDGPNGNCTYYKIGISTTNKETDVRISAIAGDETVGVDTEFIAKVVGIASGDVSIVSDDVKYFKDLTVAGDTSKYFAIIQDKLVGFEVLMGNSSTGIKSVLLENVVVDGFDNNNLSYERNGISANEFELRGRNNKTQALKLTISFFIDNAGVVEVGKTTVNLEVATCSSIDAIYLTPNKHEIIYINKKYEDTSSVEIEFSSAYNPSEVIKFSKGDVSNITGVKLSVGGLVGLDQDRTKFYLVDNGIEKEIQNNQIIKLAGGPNILNGKIIVKISEKLQSTNEIHVNFVSMFFEEELFASNVTLYHETEYKSATRIELTDVSQRVVGGSTINEIEKTFLNTKAGEDVVVEFGAKADYAEDNAKNYDDLIFIVDKIKTDEDGAWVTDTNNEFVIDEYGYEYFSIVNNNGEITLNANKNHGGGYFRIRIASKDSYLRTDTIVSGGISIDIDVYDTYVDVFFTLTDGSKNARYVIYSDEDLLKINDNLTSHFVLGASIELDSSFAPIGGNVEFDGSLVGTRQSTIENNIVISTRYTITYTINQIETYTESTTNAVAGLFARLGERGEVADVDLEVSFNTSSLKYNVAAGKISIGAVAGESKGVIKNVGLIIKSNIEFIGGTENIDSQLNFGGLVGINNGDIILGNSVIQSSGEVTLTTSVGKTQNIGIVAGENTGYITGEYQNKSDLNDIVYSVIANLQVENKSIDSSNRYNIGGVSGNNSGIISGIIVGGTIDVYNITAVGIQGAKGYLAGIAGVNTGTVETNVVLALDLTSNSSALAVAGVVGENTNIVTDSRVISVIMDFDNITDATTGKITGNGIVAGAVALNKGTVSWIGVEGFVSKIDADSYYMLKSTANTVAGLVYNNTATGAKLECSFINANINANSSTNVHLTADANELDTYFIGRVGGSYAEPTSTYAVITDIDYKVLETKGNVSKIGPNWAIDDDALDNVNNYNYVDGVAYPYLVKNGEMFMILRPTSLNVSLTAKYSINHEREHIVNFDFDSKKIEEAIIINYIDAEKEYNTYKIAELISKEVMPIEAQGGIRYQVVNGGNLARIKDDEIIFMGVSRDEKGIVTPIVIRCYSVFNSDIDNYVMFFTEFGITDMVLSSTSIVEHEGEQIVNTHIAGGDILVNLESENKNAISSETLFNAKNAENFISINVNNLTAVNGIFTVTNAQSKEILYVNVNDAFGSGIIISVNEDAEINEREELTLNISLKLDLNEYLDSIIAIADTELNIITKTLKVIVSQGATSIEIEQGGDFGSYQTNANVGFKVNMLTNYVDAGSSASVQSKYDENKIYFNETNKDSIEIVLDVIEGEDVVRELRRENGNCATSQLFDVRAYYNSIMQGTDVIGYEYFINLCLKDDFSHRYITKPFTLEVTFRSVINKQIKDVVQIEFKPTKVSTIRIENYSAKISGANNPYIDLITKSNTETSIISPGENGVMIIYMSPSYAYIDENSLKIISEEIEVPSSNDKIAYIAFEQLVKNGEDYNTILPANEEIKEGVNGKTNGSKLKLISNKDGSYDGILYVRTFLRKFSGVNTPVKVHFEANIGESEPKVVSKTLVTTYLPGVSLEYKGAQNENGQYFGAISVNDGYLIQNKTYNNILDVKVFGYQFSQNPSFELEWLIDGINDCEYPNIDNKSIMQKNGNLFNIYDYVTVTKLTDYQDAIRNDDGSYTIKVNVSVNDVLPANFRLKVGLTIINDTDVLQTTSSIDFYPTNYILRDLHFAGVSENNILDVALNSSHLFELIFDTDRTNGDYSEDIYKKLLKDLGCDVAGNGSTYKKLFTYGNNSFDDEIKDFDIEFIQLNGINYISLIARNVFNTSINFNVKHSYVIKNGMFELEFSADNGRYDLEKSFKLNIYSFTTEENAIPIHSAEEFIQKLNNGANTDFILMNDIELENYTPITTQIASLDGNNKVIKIKSFKLDKTITNYGLFGSLSTYTYTDVKNNETETRKSILKNVVVDYSELESNALYFTNNEMNQITFGGLVAENSGLIYNCDVINLSNSQKTINVLMDNGSSLTFGGLIGKNSGIITNSRVGRSTFTKVSYDGFVVSPNVSENAGLKFVIGNVNSVINNTKVNVFNSAVGGFVGENSGIISSSYVSNTSIMSYAEEIEVGSGKLAGFVAENKSNGEISYSYVRASDSSMSATSVFNSGNVIESTTDARIAGFVYKNVGNVNNSFANIQLKTTAKFLAGFVDNNSGTISESYAAATMNDHKGGFYNSERPFVGVNDTLIVQNSGVIENCYYVMESATQEYEYEPATGMLAENMQNSENLIGFVFVLSSSKHSRDQGVWSYYSIDGKPRILPELVSSNQVAISVRKELEQVEVEEGVTQTYEYTYLSGYEAGKSVNPYVIRSAEEFNKVFTSTGIGTYLNPKSKYGYVRFIDNIDFSTKKTAIQTRAYFTLGDNRNTTSIDGNGMSINGIYLDADSGETIDSIGLFAEIKNSYVKNLNLNFIDHEGQTSTSSIISVGGLAGRIENSAIININMSGGILIQGQNMVGGLAGIVKGSSMLHGITSDLNARVNLTSTKNIYGAKDVDENEISYAGGIAGVLDMNAFGNEAYNVAYIDVIGGETTNISYNIQADFVGGVAGYASQGTNTMRAKYHIGNTSKMCGAYVAGGIYGLAFGDIIASQVSHMPEETTQHNIDSAIADYIVKYSSDNSVNLSKDDIGNINLIESHGFGGGLVGVHVGGQIQQSYAKASFASGDVVGGLVGATVQSSINFSYAVPFINLTYVNEQNNFKKIGGLIGEMWEKDATNQVFLTACETLLDTHTTDPITYLDSTYSTVHFDGKVNLSTETKIDYLCSNYNQSIAQSKNGGTIYNVYVGTVATYNVANSSQDNSKSIVSSKLLNLKNASTQEITFDEIFSTWDRADYWSLDEKMFYPLLKDKEVSKYIEIWVADDFNLLIHNPDKKFMVMQNIDMSNWCRKIGNSNYILNVEFEGTLVGKLDDGNPPQIFNLSLKPGSYENSGFFKATTKATIMDLNFVWKETSDNGVESAIHPINNLKIFGGVSTSDLNSEFRSLNVSSDNGDFFNSTNTIEGFGGIVGTANNSSIMSCTFNGNVNVELAGENSYFGGIVAKGYTLDNVQADVAAIEEPGNEEPDTEQVKGMTINNCNINTSAVNYATNFTITIDDNITAYIGGIFGYLQGAAVSGANYQINKFKIKSTDTPNSTIIAGGLGGYIGNIGGKYSITSCDVITDISVNSTVETAHIAGLIGQVNGEGEIEKSSVGTTIDLTTLNATTLSTSAGVAMAGGVNIIKCLFNGEINTEAKNEITNIYAGGAIGLIDGNVTLQEVLTNVPLVVGSSATTTMVAGGIVGGTAGVDALIITINSCISLGRIVPITSETIENTSYVGGMAGRANIIKANTSYSLSSIITDSVGLGTISNANYKVNALFGEGVSDTEAYITDVYYSSDFALCIDVADKVESDGAATENEDGITNISAQTILYSTAWQNAFVGVENCLFNNITATESKLPMLKCFDINTLKKFGLYIEESSIYTKGTSLNPTPSNSGKLNSEDGKYMYYIASSTNGTPLSYEGSLNGVLIGADVEYKLGTTINAHNGMYSGIVPHVAKHSAVSNVHIKFADEEVISNAVANTFGTVVGLNEGVVFNCSTMGHQVNMTDSNNMTFGAVVGQNSGMVSSSFSTIELITINTKNYVGGIVGQNNKGQIMSCYFNGYINNGETKAGGIVGTLAEKGYIYNSYMAGVVVDVNSETNSFVGYVDEKNGNGRSTTGINNFVDGRFTMEEVSGVYGINSYSTIYLMCNKIGENNTLLKGNWDLQVTTEAKTISESISDLEFKGYNFGYPVIAFNKKFADSDERLTDAISTKYHEYTGTGKEYTGETLQDRYQNIKEDETVDATNYEDAIKIPHIGVLNVLRNMTTNTSRNYVLVYNINGEKQANNNINWNAINNFTGLIISDEYLSKTGSFVTISNFNNQGLFSGISNAFIADIKFGGNWNLTASGVLGADTKIDGKDVMSVAGICEVRNITYSKDTTVFNNDSETYIGGLFGTINNDTTLRNIKTDNLTLYGEDDTVGLISGKMTGGTLSIIQLLGNSDPVSGIKTEYKGQQLDLVIAKDNVLKVNIGENGANVIGGIVGEFYGGAIKNGIYSVKQQNGEEETFNPALTVKFEKKFIANKFGAVAGIINGGTEISNVAIIGNIEVEQKDTSNTYYGLVAGEHSDSNLIINNLILNDNIGKDIKLNVVAKKVGVSYDENNNSTGVGGLVGKLNGDITANIVTYTEDKSADVHKLQLKSTILNLGSIAGVYESGKVQLLGITNPDGGAATIFTLDGKANVGGVFGLVNGNLYTENLIEVTTEPDDWSVIYSSHYARTGEDGSYKYSQVVDAEWKTDVKYFKITNDFVNVDKKPTDWDISYKNYYIRAEDAVNGLSYTQATSTWDDTKDYRFLLKNTYHLNGIETTSKIANIAINSEKTVTYTPEADCYKNFGGLFGLLKSDLPEMFVLKADGTIGKTIIANNNALTLEERDGGTGGVDIYSAYNIGGIAGKYVSNSSSPTVYNMVNNAKIGDNVNPAKIDFTTKTKTVNVGGIFGYVSGNASINGVDVANTVSGFQNVGGYIGYYNANNKDQADAANFLASQGLSTVTVSGAVGVGGLFGYLNNTYLKSSESTPLTDLDINGNTNVGALAGIIKNSRIEYFNITTGDKTYTDNYGNQQTKECTIKINAIYTSEKIDDNTITAIPTSVGGLAGKVLTSNLVNNTINDVEITSAQEGIAVELTISTVSNYMYAGNNSETETQTSNAMVQDFNTIKSGFGGFVGTMDNDSLKAKQIKPDGSEGDSSIPTNIVQDISINSSLGVNVGTFYGYVYSANNLVTPKLEGTIAVDGGYNIGGVAGYLESDLNASNSFSNNDVSGIATINLQEQLPGMYVGGLFGKLYSANAYLTLKNTLSDYDSDINVIINTTSSYYIGGLVGRWEAVGMGPQFIGYVGEKLSKNTMYSTDYGVTNTAYNDPLSAQEFGGILGMLKVVDKNEDGVTVKVGGIHYYPFTVNTIENSNYTDGTSIYNSQEYTEQTEQKEVYLIAQSNYTNKDEFTITPSSNTDFVDIVSSTNTYKFNSLSYFETIGNYAGISNIPKSQLEYFVSVEALEELKNKVEYVVDNQYRGSINITKHVKECRPGNTEIRYDTYENIPIDETHKNNVIDNWLNADYNGMQRWLYDLVISKDGSIYQDPNTSVIYKYTYDIQVTCIESSSSDVDNPFRFDKTLGWHKDYSGFRKMQRCITQTSDFGDSIAVLFDAGNIREINVNPSDPTKINYIIYEQTDGNVILYARNAKATLLTDKDGNFRDSDGNFIEVDSSIGKDSGYINGTNYENKFVEITNGVLDSDGSFNGVIIGKEVIYYEKLVRDESYYNGATFIVEEIYEETLETVNLFNIPSGERRYSLENEQLAKANKKLNKGKYKKAEKFNKEAAAYLEQSYSGVKTGENLAKYYYYESNGLLGYSYTRELKYDNKNLNSTYDSVIESIDESINGYLYYSDSRPTDYYNKYWLVFNYLDNTKETIASKDNRTYFDGAINDSTTDSYARYVYYHGAYYIHPYAEDVYYTQTQLIDPWIYGYGQIITGDKGLYYTYGDYDGSEYKLKDASGTLLPGADQDNRYGENNWYKQSDEKFVYYYDFENSDIYTGGAELDPGEQPTFSYYKLGYDYLTANALYIAFEDTNIFNEGSGLYKNIQCNIIKDVPAAYPNLESYIADLDRSTYIEFTLKNGEKVYYGITNTINNTGAKTYNEHEELFKLLEEVSSDLESISLTVYPSLTDNEHGVYSTGNYYLINSRNLLISDINGYAYKAQNVKYFYFEGGYYKKDSELYSDEACTNLLDSSYVISSGLSNKYNIEDNHLTRRSYNPYSQGQNNFNYNKFETNKDYGVYTRYKYGNPAQDFKPGVSVFGSDSEFQGYYVTGVGGINFNKNRLYIYNLKYDKENDCYYWEPTNGGQPVKVGGNVIKDYGITTQYHIGAQIGNFENNEAVRIDIDDISSIAPNIDPTEDGKCYAYWNVIPKTGNIPNSGYKTYFVESVVTNFGADNIIINTTFS